ncbi:MAG: T9SS type A sorting domain-containing protein [Bacteroidota bacterium]
MKRLLFFSLSLFVSYFLSAQAPVSEEGDPIIQYDQGTLSKTAGSRWDASELGVGDEQEGDYIQHMEFTPDGTEAWVVNRVSNNISVYDPFLVSWKESFNLGFRPIEVDFSEELAVIIAGDPKVFIVDIASKEVLANIDLSFEPFKVLVSPDGSIAIIAGESQAQVLDLQSQSLGQIIPGAGVGLYKFSFITSNLRSSIYYADMVITPDNAFLVNGWDDTGLRFFSLADGSLVNTLPEVANIGQLTLSGDQSKILALDAGSDGIAYQIDWEAQTVSASVTISGQSVFSNYSPPATNFDGSKLFCSVSPGNTALVDFTDSTFQLISTGNTPDWVGQGPNYEYAIAGDFYLAAIDFETGSVTGLQQGISIQNGAVSPVDGRIIASDPLRNEGMYFYSFNDLGQIAYEGYQISGSPLEGDSPYAVEFTPNGEKLLSINALSGTLTIFDLETTEQDTILALGSTETFQVAITSDSRYALVAKRMENTVMVIDIELQAIVAEVPSGGSKPDQIFILPGDEFAYVLNAGGADNIGVIQLDGASSSIVQSITVGNVGVSWQNYGIRSNIAFDEAGNYGVLACPFSNIVQMIDLNTHTVVNEIPLDGFPLRVEIAEGTDLGTFVGVTRLFESSIAIIEDIGPDAELIDIYTCNSNPTTIQYEEEEQRFVVTTQDGQDGLVEYFDLLSLGFSEMVSYSPFEALAVQYLPSGEEVVLLQSLDTDLFPHQVRIDGEIFDLPGLPFQYFAVDTAGLQVAIPQPGMLDAVYLLQEEVEDPMSWQSVLLNDRQQNWAIFPNPVNDQFNILWTGNLELPQSASWQLRDAQGRVVSSKEIGMNTSIIRSENWSAGWYSYEIVQDGKLVQSGPLLLR